MSPDCDSPCSTTWLGLQRLIQADVKSKRVEVTETLPSFSAPCTAPAELPSVLFSAVTVLSPSASKLKHRHQSPAVHPLCSKSHPSDPLCMAIATQTVGELIPVPREGKARRHSRGGVVLAQGQLQAWIPHHSPCKSAEKSQVLGTSQKRAHVRRWASSEGKWGCCCCRCPKA